MPFINKNTGLLLFCFLFLVSLQNKAQDVTGKWQGIFHTDMGWKPRDFFLTMLLQQDKKTVKGIFSNADIDATNKPNVVYKISGFIGKNDKLPITMRVGTILVNNLAPGVAEVFLEFENIRYFKNDTAEILYGRWIPNGPGPGGYFWVRKMLSPENLPQQQFAKKNTTNKSLPDTVSPQSKEQSPIAAIIKRNNIEQARLQADTNIITLNLYDNGIVDDDTVSVFFNGKMLLNQQRVSDKVLTLTLELKPGKNEIVLYANNVGLIPPNTVLLTVKAGAKFHQLILNSDTKDNAVLAIEYIPKE